MGCSNDMKHSSEPKIVHEGKTVARELFPGYEIVENLSARSRISVYRVRCQQDGMTYVIKALTQDPPEDEDIEHLRREYRILTRVAGDGIVRAHELQRLGARWAIRFEDIGGAALDTLIQRERPSPWDSFPLAIRLSEIIGHIHENSVIHKDINPTNIIIEQSRGIIQIVDFGISAELSSERPALLGQDRLEGTLPFISPEQTGRTNNAVDHRSDLYSLGVTLYYLTTHALPFDSTDPMELVYCHLARTPRAPHEINDRIPETLSRIILKLMAKGPEDRYQSASGLTADLRELSGSWHRSFVIGTRDHSSRFEIPQRLYGREDDIACITAAFERVAGGNTEIVTLLGDAGTGKSVLVRELNKQLVRESGLFASGKFEQLKRDTPYEPFIRAFAGLLRSLLASSSMLYLRKAIADAVGPNARVLIELIPEVAAFVDDAAELPTVSAMESQHRFHYVFERFVSAFAESGRPLILFLDDVHWADAASLKLIEHLALRQSQSLLVIIAYRDSDEVLLVQSSLERIRQQGVRISERSLGPLDVSTVTRLLGDTLRADATAVAPLAEICFRTTQGNPFFLHQFLGYLHGLGHIVYSWTKGRWNWDVEAIARLPVPNQVLQLLLDKLDRMPPEAARLLGHAACIGNPFEYWLLGMTLDGDYELTARAVWAALEQGFITPLSPEYRLVGVSTGYIPSVTYRFVHDSIQEAAYRLLEPDERMIIHRRIGLHLKSKLDDDRNFDVVSHLNAARALLTDEVEKVELAELNLRTGRRALKTGSYEPALRLLDIGIEILGDEGWRDHHELMVQLHDECCVAARLAGDLERVRGYVDTVARVCSDPIETVQAHASLVMLLAARGHHSKAIALGIERLDELGDRIPDAPTKLRLAFELMRTRRALARVGPERLLELPTNQDRATIARTRIGYAMAFSTAVVRPELNALMVFRAVRNALEHGTTWQSPAAFVTLALMLANVFGKQRHGYSLAKAAVALAEAADGRPVLPVTQFIRHFLVGPWCEPARDIAAIGFALYRRCLEVGQVEQAYYAFEAGLPILFFTSPNVGELLEQTLVYRSAILKHNPKAAGGLLDVLCEMMAAIVRGGDEELRALRGPYIGEDDQAMRARLDGRTQMMGWLLDIEAFTLALHGHYRAAVERSEQRSSMPSGVMYPLWQPWSQMLCAAARLALERVPRSPGARAAIARIRPVLRKARTWASLCRENYSAGYLLLRAEIARLEARDAEAQRLYRQALQVAGEGHLWPIEAFIGERHALFMLDAGDTEYGYMLMARARSQYAAWGALSKIAMLDARYPDCVELTRTTVHRRPNVTYTTTQNMMGDALDIESIFRASQSIAQQVEFTALISEIMKITLQNAGAERGFLMLAEQGTLRARVEGKVAEDTIVSLSNRDLDAMELELCVAIVRRAQLGRQAVTVDHAMDDEELAYDPYVIANRCRSIAVLPIVHMGELVGLLYLENRLVPGAFSAGRMQALAMLAAQAAISLNNVRYIEEIAKRTRLENDMAAARAVQEALLPTEREVPGVSIVTHYRAADETGGDWYTYQYDHDSKRLYVFIGDVTGHGLASALVTGAACGAIHSACRLLQPLAALSIPESLERLAIAANQAILDTGARVGRTMTMAMLCIDMLSGKAAYLSAGHTAPLVVQGSKVDVISLTSKPLGSTSVHVQHRELELAPGDRIILFTDGLVENTAPSGKPLSVRKLGRLLAHARDLLALKRELLALIEATLDGHPAEDDCTFVAIERTGTS